MFYEHITGLNFFATQAVRRAIIRTMTTATEHWNRTAASRLEGHPLQSGSYYPYRNGVEQVADRLLGVEWSEFPHPDIKAPGKGFRARLGGFSNMVTLECLPNDFPMLVVASEKPYTTPEKVEVEVLELVINRTFKGPVGDKAPTVISCDGTVESHTTLIIGDNDGLVWTFFPGEPVPPFTVLYKAHEHLVGTTITAKVAKALGFKHAKVSVRKL